MSIADLKKRRADALNKLRKTVEDGNKGGGFEDDRFWKLKKGKDGSGQAIIRFLPSTENVDSAWATVYQFFFKGPTGKWYVENCLRTIGKEDPVAEYNAKRWADGFQDECRRRSQKTKFISNILVVKDPADPSNEGKVFLFEYGKKVMEMIKNQLTPDFEDDEPVNPFDMWEGCNFRLKMHTVTSGDRKYPSYDNSTFDKQSAIGDDERIEEVYSKVYDISEFTDPAKHKSYDELQKKFYEIEGINKNRASSKEKTQDEFENEKANEQSKKSVENNLNDDVPDYDSDGDDDDFLAKLKDLVDDED